MNMTMLTGGAIQWYKWLAAQKALEMEINHGLKSRAFKVARSSLIRQLGLPPRTKNDKMLEAIKAKVEECRKAIKPGEVEP